MFRSQLFKTNKLSSGFSKKYFSTFDYDVCIVGGGPAGNLIKLN